MGSIAAVVAAFALMLAGCANETIDPALVPLTDANPTGPTAAVTTTTTTTTIAPETVDEFIDAFVGAYRTGNPVFLVQRIHPQLRDYYGRESCRAIYEEFIPDDTAKATIRSITGPAAWSDIFDGATFDFSAVYTLDIEFVDFGWTRRQDMQLALVDDRYYYFQDCGEAASVTTTTVDVALLDPDGDGLYFVHRAPADSEDFLVPAMFRITYTGTDSTCAFALLDSAGEELVYVIGLEGGGLKRIILPEPTSTAYMSDILGCRGGELQVGPNP